MTLAQRTILIFIFFLLICASSVYFFDSIQQKKPSINSKVEKSILVKTLPNFSGITINNISFEIDSLLEENSYLVVVMIRGYPGYQCPVCSAQLASYIAESKNFKDKKTASVFIYPGNIENLSEKGEEFLNQTEYYIALPENIYFVIDKHFSITNLLNLRWEHNNETAHPATFIINKQRQILYSRKSETYYNRLLAQDALKKIEKYIKKQN